MDVVAVGRHETLAGSRAAKDGQSGVEEGNAENEKDGNDGFEGCGGVGRRQGEGGEEEAEEEAAGIAHENGRRVPVMIEKAEEGAEEDGDKNEVRAVAAEGGEEGEAGDSNDGNAGGETVQAVDQVDGVHDADNPEQGDEKGDDVADGGAGEEGEGIEVEAVTRGHDEEGSHELGAEFFPGGKALEVIIGADQADEESGEEEEGLGLVDQPAKRGNQNLQDLKTEQANEETADDSQAAEAGNGLGVAAAVVGAVEEVMAQGEALDRVGEKVGGQSGQS